jgi:ribonuclease HI
MDYLAPLAVGLDVVHAYGRTAWGLASSEDHQVAAAARPNATEADAFLSGFETLLRDEQFRGRGIDLYCPNLDLCAHLSSMANAWPHLTVTMPTEQTANGLLVRTARRAARLAITDPAVSTDVDSTSRILAATDGSSGFRRGGAVSGWGWVSNIGLYDVGTHPTGDILAAELYAICRVVKATPAHRPLTVQVDSKAALTVVDALRRGASPLSFPVSREMHLTSLMRRLVERLDGRDATFEWVPSHAGHALNEGADRLAVMARRTSQAGLPKSAREPLAERIVAEALAAHRSVTLAA